MRKCLNKRNVHSTMYEMAYTNWFLRRYSWLIISMYRVYRRIAHIMFFNSFVLCLWWVVGSELEVMFGHSEKVLSPNAHRLIWYHCEDVLYIYIYIISYAIIYLVWQSRWVSDSDPWFRCSIPFIIISLFQKQVC